MFEDENMLAILLEDVELLVAFQDEALKNEGSLCPWPIQLGDVNPEGQLVDRYFAKLHASTLCQE